MEEFRAYFGSFGLGKVIIPPVRQNIYKVLAAVLELSGGAARYLVSNGYLNTMWLIEMLYPSCDLTDMTYQSECMTALCKCLLAAYLSVAIQIED
ncbi:hypothetical protein RHMOL_Rhmol01G0171600 [Rhododendron molle]|uniref:Uncharacterized protein n=1 Tax=Rhododendron molle TaxID=49168 RepID=A0ACC0Q3R8_RHOML|nr:hypothetical protein RHMOL_Rhmol01G0171600 [Rhododendron molle]